MCLSEWFRWNQHWSQQTEYRLSLPMWVGIIQFFEDMTKIKSWVRKTSSSVWILWSCKIGPFISLYLELGCVLVMVAQRKRTDMMCIMGTGWHDCRNQEIQASAVCQLEDQEGWLCESVSTRRGRRCFWCKFQSPWAGKQSTLMSESRVRWMSFFRKKANSLFSYPAVALLRL